MCVSNNSHNVTFNFFARIVCGLLFSVLTLKYTEFRVFGFLSFIYNALI